jgi:hypothetical protein
MHAAQAEVKRLKSERETLYVTIHGMQDGAVVRDQMALIERLQAKVERLSGGKIPDTSPGYVIASYPDGTIVLDDGITTWNPERACKYLTQQLALQRVENEKWKTKALDLEGRIANALF